MGARRLSTANPAEDLNPQQLELALAASGLTNRQIGERLDLSHRTIGTHLYASYALLSPRSSAAQTR
jgi:DNA-binding NarL/FixJ family response regulator